MSKKFKVENTLSSDSELKECYRDNSNRIDLFNLIYSIIGIVIGIYLSSIVIVVWGFLNIIISHITMFFIAIAISDYKNKLNRFKTLLSIFTPITYMLFCSVLLYLAFICFNILHWEIIL